MGNQGIYKLDAQNNVDHQHNGLDLQDPNFDPMKIRQMEPGKERVALLSDDGDRKSSGATKDLHPSSTKIVSKSPHKGKKVVAKMKGRRYPLRSSFSGARVLRSMSNKVNKSTPPAQPVDPIIEIVGKRKKKKKTMQVEENEVSKVRRRVRYLLMRMGYEQNFIDAYSSEGWKGQSLEKIRPEKELERAKSEIAHRKLRLRELFQHLDSLISKGKLQDDLFDSEGQIDSEDIICAKCGSKDLYVNNDIVLCDGICDRGFHQKCITPMLENVPPGDESWLCPECDCKADCLDLVNELQGTDLSLEDNWEKVFPEAAAIASGNKLYDDLGLPSDDSEGDYAPSDSPDDDQKTEESSSEESFTSSEGSHHTVHDENFGLPSDDSEDNDYDPNKLDTVVKSLSDGTGSSESDFTSDTDDLDGFNVESCEATETATSSIRNCDISRVEAAKERSTRCRNNPSVNAELRCLMDPESGQNDVVLASGKRGRQNLDYKKLYDEAYGDASDSSDSEDWTDTKPSKKTRNCGASSPTKCATTIENQVNARVRKTKHNKESASPNPKFEGVNSSATSAATLKRRTRKEMQTCVIGTDAIKQGVETSVKKSTKQRSGKMPSDGSKKIIPKEQHPDVSSELPEFSPKGRNHGKLANGCEDHSFSEQHRDFFHSEPDENKASTTSYKQFSIAVSQKLRECFDENQYPSRRTKENLAKQLGITIKQVNKWFERTRHNLRVADDKSPGTAGCKTVTTLLSMKNIRSCEKDVRQISIASPHQETLSSTVAGVSYDHPEQKVTLAAVTCDNTNERAGFQKSGCSPHQKKPTMTAANFFDKNCEKGADNTVSDTRNDISKPKGKEMASGSSDRDKLVLRELRKRRKSK